MTLPSEVENICARIPSSALTVPYNIERVTGADNHTQIAPYPNDKNESYNNAVDWSPENLTRIKRPVCEPSSEKVFHSRRSRRSRRLEAMTGHMLPKYGFTSDTEDQKTVQPAKVNQNPREHQFPPASDDFTKMLPKRKRRAANGKQRGRENPFEASQTIAADAQYQNLPKQGGIECPAKRLCSRISVIDISSGDETSNKVKKERFPTPQPSTDHNLYSNTPSKNSSGLNLRLHDGPRASLNKQESRIVELEATVRRLCEMCGLVADTRGSSRHVHRALKTGQPVMQEAVDSSTDDPIAELGMIQSISEMVTEPAHGTADSVDVAPLDTQALGEAFGEMHEPTGEFSTTMGIIRQDGRLSQQEKEDFELRWVNKLKRLQKKHRLEVLDLIEDLKTEFNEPVSKGAEKLRLALDEDVLPSNEGLVLASKCDQSIFGVVASGGEGRNTREKPVGQTSNPLEEQEMEDRSDIPSEYLSLEE
ncbi:MAG: hypothetical protein Q9216_001098 [Gyalolechia sp. 2 TL-2023]